MSEPVHFQRPADSVTVCGLRHARYITHVAALVTCGVCKENIPATAGKPRKTRERKVGRKEGT